MRKYELYVAPRGGPSEAKTAKDTNNNPLSRYPEDGLITAVGVPCRHYETGRPMQYALSTSSRHSLPRLKQGVSSLGKQPYALLVLYGEDG